MLRQHAETLTRTLDAAPRSKHISIEDTCPFAVHGSCVLLNKALVGD